MIFLNELLMIYPKASLENISVRVFEKIGYKSLEKFMDEL